MLSTYALVFLFVWGHLVHTFTFIVFGRLPELKVKPFVISSKIFDSVHRSSSDSKGNRNK